MAQRGGPEDRRPAAVGDVNVDEGYAFAWGSPERADGWMGSSAAGGPEGLPKYTLGITTIATARVFNS